MAVEPMRAVFINHCHPDTPHVCALRLRSFAETMAARGHQIVLLTETLNAGDAGQDRAGLPDDLASHDWSKPFRLAVRPDPDEVLSDLRNGLLPSGIRQLAIALRYFRQSGVFGDWQKGACVYLPMLARDFKPDVVWATFGNTDSWKIAQDLARLSNCPWVGDVKDNWAAFLPTGFRQLIANRFQDMARMTAFSESHRDHARQWFANEAAVVYSGFDAATLEPDIMNDGIRILLTGSLYGEQRANELVKGITLWLRERGTDGPAVEFRYAGADSERARVLAQPLGDLCQVVIDGFLPVEKLRALQMGAWVNAYMYSERALFQHKPIELLAAGRPILACPAESAEVLSIAGDVSGNLQTCETAGQIAAYLGSLAPAVEALLIGKKMAEYSWQGQVEVLESVLNDALNEVRGAT